MLDILNGEGNSYFSQFRLIVLHVMLFKSVFMLTYFVPR